MHIVDGALAPSVIVAASAVSVGGLALGLKRLDAETLPRAGLLSAAFFVASLVQVPIGPSSVHLVLGGLAGLMLGWAAFPALAVALALQAVFFGFGGLTVLGVNTLTIAMPAVLVGLACRAGVRSGSAVLVPLSGAVAGGLSVALTTILVGAALAASGDAFIPAAKLVFLAHVPVMIAEALVTAAAVTLLAKVKPDAFGLPAGTTAGTEGLRHA
ncbi:Substrate-specific component NikM of nickel ECF transporter [Caenispirillum salinarum AK4]|uniref:Substrate-specific component NikM of nickel ECF transporter n=1 Tax=Caenispirillum salinarum AK4 TaxID=1238182 RepID=K9H5Q0_9PROT|nr:cobalt transporter CbiM [Caenispirillum salinarum]EKV32429.1 Substrate-specific component NikM of nickel ECF transporter [Caenispirillum salinarum AK4]